MNPISNILNANGSMVSQQLLDHAASMANISLLRDDRIELQVAPDLINQFTGDGLPTYTQARIVENPDLHGEIWLLEGDVIVSRIINVAAIRPSVWGTHELGMRLRQAERRLAAAANTLVQQTQMIASFYPPYSAAYLSEWSKAISEAQGATEQYRVALARWTYDAAEKAAASSTTEGPAIAPAGS